MKKNLLLLLFTFIAMVSKAQVNCNLVCNPDFDSIQYPNNNYFVDSTQMPCWHTTAADGQFEVWGSGFNGVPSYSGDQFLELNAYFASTIYQNITAIPGTNLSIHFAHRGRAGVDTLSLSIGPVGGPYTTLGYFGDGTSAWGYYTVNYTIPNMGNNYSIRFNSVYAALGNPAIGNFLDDVSVCATNVGISESGIENSVSFFPNPFSDKLEIRCNRNDYCRVILYDDISRKVIDQSFHKSVSINTKEFTKGIYFYELRNKDRVIKTGKLTKE